MLWFTGSTQVWHNLEEDHYVSGYEEPGSYVKNITYSTSLQQVIALIDNAIGCKQHINMKCLNSGIHDEQIHHSWWQNRDGDNMYNWGAPMGTDGCDCSTRNGKVDIQISLLFQKVALVA